MDKKILIGIGVLAVTGIALYMYNKKGKTSKEANSNIKGNKLSSLNEVSPNIGKSVGSGLIAPKGYTYVPTQTSRENCGSGCKYLFGICWCLKIGKASGQSGLGGECPLGTQCSLRVQGQCVQCSPAGSGVRV